MDKSKMTFLIYLMPFLANVCAGTVSTYLVMRAAALNASPVFISAIAVLYGSGMFMSAFIFSKLKLKFSVYKNIIYTAPMVQVLVAVIMFFYLPKHFIYVYGFLFGVCSISFFVAYQSVLSDVSKHFPLKISTGVYILSWTSGLAVGPVITGFIFNINSNLAIFVMCAVNILIVLIYYITRHVKVKKVKKENSDIPRNIPRYKVFVGRCVVFNGAFILNVLRFMFVDYGLRLKISNETVGLLVGVFTASVGIGALISALRIVFFERKRVFFTVSVLAVLALFVMSFNIYVSVFFFVFVILGFIAGFGYFFGIYYAICDSENTGNNIAINESLSGIGSLVGPFVFGLLASKINFNAGFVFMMLVVFTAFTLAIYIMRKNAKNKKVVI